MNKTIATLLGTAFACASLGAQTQNMLPAKISTDMVLEANSTWHMSGYTYVMPGSTLTINEGVTIYADEGTGAEATALVVARGAMIDAQGTADAPIIFTPESAATTDLDQYDTGMWGGVIILGSAVLNSNKAGSWTGTYPTQDVEGMVPAAGDEALINYGGDNDTDNSGIFSYVSIRHGGAIISDGNEINGLTLGGVGSGTQIDHVEVFANKDDGIEIFGGTVDINHIAIAFSYDDGLDLDEGWRGYAQNIFVIQTNGAEGGVEDKGDKGGEWDGADKPNDGTPLMMLNLANATFIGMGELGDNTAINIKANGAAHVYNSIFVDYAKMIQIDTSTDQQARYTNGDIDFWGNIWYSHVAANNTAEGLSVIAAGTTITPDVEFFTAQGNQIADPGLTISRDMDGMLDVTPAADSIAATAAAGVTLPAAFEQTTYIGAFAPGDNWLAGWTKLDAAGFLAVDGYVADPSLGWLYVFGDTMTDVWAWSYSLNNYVYIADQDATGGWVYVVNKQQAAAQ